MDKAMLAKYLEDGLSLEKIGRIVGRDASTVAYWVKKHGLEARGRARYRSKGGLRRESLSDLIELGMTIRQIAERLERSTSTVNYWLRQYGITTLDGPSRRRRRQARLAGEKQIKTTCRRHGLSTFVLEGRGYYRCTRCRQEAVARRRRKMKSMLVREAGGSCVICGYDRYQGALQFHHLDPTKKQFHLSRQGVTMGIDRLRQEANKCILLCSNCHAELEGGLANLPK